MEYRRLGNTDIEVSCVCMGTWATVSGGSDYWGSQSHQDSLTAIRTSLDRGINFFDTAEDYGEGSSEQLLGEGLGDRRRDAVVATKVGPRHSRPEQIKRACEESLQRLGTDYIDLYQIHWPSPEVAVEDQIAALMALRDEGKIRTLGVSNFGTSYLHDLQSGPVQTNQLPYSLLWRAIEFEILPASREKGLGILAYSPLAQGILTGKYESMEDVPDGRKQTRFFSSRWPEAAHGESGQEELLFETVGRVRELCRSVGEPMDRVAVAWVLAHEEVAAVIVGARNREQAADNAEAAGVDLSADFLQQLDSATEQLKESLGRNGDMWQHESRMERHPVRA
ncbi:MAG: aldo/keto reductase [Phycisphaerae bacterium]|nr:aldo/keto reductase [Phycisphaerae bacterium]